MLPLSGPVIAYLQGEDALYDRSAPGKITGSFFFIIGASLLWSIITRFLHAKEGFSKLRGTLVITLRLENVLTL